MNKSVKISVTSTSNEVGTLTYMAPEQMLEGGGIKSDIYSLGIILFELFSVFRWVKKNNDTFLSLLLCTIV